MKARSCASFWLSLAILAIILPRAEIARGDGIYRETFTAGGWYLTIELLDDDLAHVQFSTLDTGPISTTPMVARTDYAGPADVFTPAPGTLETPELRLAIDQETLCVTFIDRIAAVTLTTMCPLTGDNTLSLALTREGATDIYGLGEQFQRRGGTEGNWIGRRRLVLNLYGNELVSFNGGNVGNAQFPIMYALGVNSDNYAFFFDDIYQQYWDLSSDPLTITTTNNVLRGYVMTGPDLPDLRRDYMELTGRPPVPPKQMFGLWVSEYSYESWDELSSVLQSLQDAAFPVDGFMLDLQWFGGIGANSQMGSLSWDQTHFPDPAAFIAALREQYGIGVMTIEEPYVADTLPDYGELAAQGILVSTCGAATCDPVSLESWWGSGGMVDWTDPQAARWWHNNRRQPLVDEGVVGHWTDLGEPEDYHEGAWYYGFPESDLHSQADIHNVYNLLWSESIWDGYQQNEVERRPFILSRSGTSGSQRYGVSMWSGDIAANMPSLEAQMNVQMHMALSGVDYFGSDVGGFYRQVFDPVLGMEGMYTIWLANSALLDVPLRPHAANPQNAYATAPSLIGDVASNLANVRRRYELSPYLYTLAHRAYRDGDAVFAPLVYYYQQDPAVRTLGSHKMIGPDLLMASLTGYSLAAIKVYLPAGGWFNYTTHETIDSAGEWFDVPTEVDGVLSAPLFVRDGAIIPQMIVDDQTMNMLGRRREGSPVADIQFGVYRHTVESGRFTLIEDDGISVAYLSGAVRETPVEFSTDGNMMTITIEAASGTFDGAPAQRNIRIRLVGAGETVVSVSLNGEELSEVSSSEALDGTGTGWFAAETEILIATGRVDVTSPLTVQVTCGED